jgi:hypothetical protein
VRSHHYIAPQKAQPLAAAPKHRAISSSARANSAGRSAGDPKHFFPASIAGNQKQLVSTGKQRNAVTARPVKIPNSVMPVGEVHIAERHIHAHRTQQLARRPHISGKAPAESPSAAAAPLIRAAFENSAQLKARLFRARSFAGPQIAKFQK